MDRGRLQVTEHELQAHLSTEAAPCSEPLGIGAVPRSYLIDAKNWVNFDLVDPIFGDGWVAAFMAMFAIVVHDAQASIKKWPKELYDFMLS